MRAAAPPVQPVRASYNDLVTNLSKYSRLAVGAVLLVLCLSNAARAQTYIVPYVGANLGGDADCAAVDCSARSVTLGGAYGFFENLFGYEEDFGYVSNLFRDGPGASSRVITLMTNGTINPKFGKYVHVYGLGGLGFVRTKVDVSPSTHVVGEDSGFGWNAGAGIVIAGEKTIGIRADWRYFQSFSDLEAIGLPVQNTHLTFGRLSVGVVIMLTRN
jgi:opacity protein-like surface antigen